MGGKHQDLKYITPGIVSRQSSLNVIRTFILTPLYYRIMLKFFLSLHLWYQMCAAMNGQFSDVVERLFIIDCRYPYEYEGGHIKVSTTVFFFVLIFGICDSVEKQPVRGWEEVGLICCHVQQILESSCILHLFVWEQNI